MSQGAVGDDSDLAYRLQLIWQCGGGHAVYNLRRMQIQKNCARTRHEHVIVPFQCLSHLVYKLMCSTFRDYATTVSAGNLSEHGF